MLAAFSRKWVEHKNIPGFVEYLVMVLGACVSVTVVSMSVVT